MRVLGWLLAVTGGVWTALGVAMAIGVGAAANISGPAAGEYAGAVVICATLTAPGAGMLVFGIYLMRRYRSGDPPATDAQPEPAASRGAGVPAAPPPLKALQLETVVLGLLGFVVFYAVGWVGTCTFGPILVRSLTGRLPPHGCGTWATPVGLVLGALGLVLGMVAASRRRR
jgi:hypothetical protein